ncbi:MAG: MFS transporter [Treponema sp.]|nr:MFS transporter [Treponema sp.]
MIIPEFLLFSIYAAANAYLPLFLRNVGYGATEIGFLYAVFNGAAVVLPLILTPWLAKKGAFATALVVLGTILVLVPFPLIYAQTFVLTALCMAVYAVCYRMIIPVSDSLITKSLGDRQERYGIIRVAGSIGFVVAALIMQRFVHAEKAGLWEMTCWLSGPAVLFTLSMLIRNVVYVLKTGPHQQKPAVSVSKPAGAPAAETSTWQILRSFGPGFYLMMFVIFMEFFGMVPANQYLSMYAEEELKVRGAGILWALSAAVEIPFMICSGFFIRRFGAASMIVTGTLSVSVRNMLYALVPGFAGCIAGQMMHSFAYGLFFPGCVAYCATASRHESRAVMLSMTLLNSVYCLATVVGAPIGGVLIDSFGYRPMFLFFACFPVFASVLYAVLNRRCR